MAKYDNRLILVIDAEAVANGWRGAETEMSGLSFIPRWRAENSPEYRQIIPYIVIRTPNGVLAYRRSVHGGETRLHGRWSLGWGGHIELPDVALDNDQLDLAATIRNCAQREVAEELGLTEAPDERVFLGFIADNSSEVSRVHLGWVEEWRYPADLEIHPDDSVADIAWQNPETISELTNIEEWSTAAAAMLPTPAKTI